MSCCTLSQPWSCVFLTRELVLTGQHDPHQDLAELLAVLVQISAALVVLKVLVLTAVPMMHVLQLEMREMLVWKEVELSPSATPHPNNSRPLLHTLLHSFGKDTAVTPVWLFLLA